MGESLEKTIHVDSCARMFSKSTSTPTDSHTLEIFFLMFASSFFRFVLVLLHCGV